MPRHALILPELGVEQGPILLSMWLVEQGSRVAEGEQLVEVLAGPATVDLPSPVDGVLVEMLVEEGDELTVGQPLAVIESTSP